MIKYRLLTDRRFHGKTMLFYPFYKRETSWIFDAFSGYWALGAGGWVLGSATATATEYRSPTTGISLFLLRVTFFRDSEIDRNPWITNFEFHGFLMLFLGIGGWVLRLPLNTAYRIPITNYRYFL